MSDKQIEEFQKEVYKEYKPLFDLHQQLLELFGETADKGNAKEVPIENISKLQSVMGFLATKAIKTHVAIYLLCKNGAGQDAEILLRSLIEILISVKYLLFADSEKRADMYIGFFDFKTARDISKLKYDPKIGEKLKEYEEEYNMKKEEFLKQHDIKDKNSWSGKKISEMAGETGLTEIYNKAYNFSSDMAHSNILCSPCYIKMGDGYVDCDAGPSFDCVERVLGSCLECIINILVDFNRVLEIGNDQRIKDFIAKYGEQIEKYKGRNNASPNP